ncbi:O-antigen ligase family protein [Zunongwangia pacifica]|uniref:O-antigen ligase family protein n=1 Tax=Zunongwangia pacifica TaxID=2911062 RepID=A0A9X1ZLE2_9FLAO|nr:O-antigen ligase family protein [Zunongwangia pacifica]MCL6216757.1 O-antigen ligase family protein [Zunongwangia pacifica]
MLDSVKTYIIDRWIIILLFILPPIFAVVNLPGKYAVISIMFLVALIYYLKYNALRTLALSYPLFLWLILTLYHWGNAVNKKVPGVDFVDLLHGIKIYSCILIFTYLARKNFEQTIKSLFICFMGYLLLSFVVNGGASNDEFHGRMSGVIFATELGQTAALSAVYIAYYSLIKNLSKLKSAFYYMLPLLVILFTQSRNSLAMFFICIIGHGLAYSYLKGKRVRNIIFVLLFFSMLGFFVFDLIIKETDLGERLTDTESVRESQKKNDLATGTLFDTVVGDRLKYYVLGWEYFTESPWTGIGMWNFKFKSNGDYPLHSEYMVHITEGGIIAFVLWGLFLISLVRGVMRSKQPKYLKVLALFSIAEILFCGIYARVFFYEFFYPVIGVALSFSSFGKPKTVLINE